MPIIKYAADTQAIAELRSYDDVLDAIDVTHDERLDNLEAFASIIKENQLVAR